MLNKIIYWSFKILGYKITKEWLYWLGFDKPPKSPISPAPKRLAKINVKPIDGLDEEGIIPDDEPLPDCLRMCDPCSSQVNRPVVCAPTKILNITDKDGIVWEIDSLGTHNRKLKDSGKIRVVESEA